MRGLALHWQILIAMALGAGVGLALNTMAGAHDSEPRREGEEKPFASIYDSSDRIEIKLFKADDEGQATDEVALHIVIDPQLPAAEIDRLKATGGFYFRHLTQFKKNAKDHADHAEAYRLFQEFGRSTARRVGDGSKTLGDLFLRLLRMVSIPLIITSLVTGVTGLGKAERLGKMFGRTMVYYLITSVLAISTGLVMVNLIKPGEGDAAKNIAAAPQDDGPEERVEKELPTVLFEQLENLIPLNPIGAAADGNFLSIIAFSLLIGVFTILVGGRTAETISGLFQALFEVMMAMTMAIIKLAPLGVLFLMLSATATQGIDIFETLGLYMLTVFLALLFHAVVTLPLILRFVAKKNPWHFAQAMSPALLTAFGSASSNGTLPLTMTSAEKRAGISNRVSSFVLPLGATINMDGTALYEVVAVLFIAQLTPGIDLTIGQQIIVAVTALLASIGAAGIPMAGLVMMTIVLQAVGLPVESQGLIIAVDRVLDMFRTSVNVWSDSSGCAVIARFETRGEG